MLLGSPVGKSLNAAARLNFLAGQTLRALYFAEARLSDTTATLLDRAHAAAVIAAISLEEETHEQAKRSVQTMLQWCAEAATLLPIAYLPLRARKAIFELQDCTSGWSQLAGVLHLSVDDIKYRLLTVPGSFPERGLLVELTPREQEMLMMLDQSFTQIEIAEQLNVAVTTIKKHIASLYKKLRVNSKKDAIRVAYQSGLLGTS